MNAHPCKTSPGAPLRRWLGLGGLLVLASSSGAQSLPQFDFTQPSGVQGWVAAHDISGLEATTNGLVISISGSDPYVFGPARDYPVNQLLWLRLLLKSDQAGMAQVFYFPAQGSPSEANSVMMYAPGGDWAELRLPMPALGPQTRLRFDPPGTGGACVLGRISFELRPSLPEPAWLKPEPPMLDSNAPAVVSGGLALAHGTSALGAFDLRVNGTNMAVGNTRSVVGYLRNQTPWWFALTNPVTATLAGGALTVRANSTDPDGGQWQVEQMFEPAATPGGIEIQSRVTVNQDRSVIFLPMLTLLPGVGTFGTNKTQALLAGLEYLENEPSSSQADISAAGWERLVPDPVKLTFPMMALAAGGNYVGLLWEPSTNFAALHDSPDRLLRSGGHLMGLIFPGADPALRQDGSVLPYDGQKLQAGQTLTLRATIIGGSGDTVVPALQQYVARRGLPPLPNTGYSAADYFALAAHGWLDTPIRNGALFRNAVAVNFGFAPAADAALFMDWLSARVPDATLKTRLTNTATYARAAVAPASYNAAAVGHVRFPVEALVYGAVPANGATALSGGQAELGLFQPDGSVLYQAPQGGLDLGSTYGTRDANGLTAGHVVSVLEDGAFCGDPALLGAGVRLVRALNKFRNSVPRGAQTWEVPLHTPDILASAWLVRCYTLAYELTGEADFLAQAQYWAWTGVPFVYLAPPTGQPVGVYATIPVFGASDFVASWFGVPVQWCGLVYADAIHRLARHDPAGPWVRLANGIASSGVQQTHPPGEAGLQGLLPDSFNLRAQARNAPAINPATLLPEALQLFGCDPVYDFRAFRHHGLLVHAPGPITDCQETSQGVSFRVSSWPQWESYLLINGFAGGTFKINGVENRAPPGHLILGLIAPALVEIAAPANDALSIERAASNSNVRLSWPRVATNYVLERAAEPGSSLPWQTVTNAPAIDGSWFIFTTPADKPMEGFRLRRQP